MHYRHNDTTSIITKATKNTVFWDRKSVIISQSVYFHFLAVFTYYYTHALFTGENNVVFALLPLGFIGDKALEHKRRFLQHVKDKENREF